MVSVKKQVARAKNETGGYADLTRSSNLTFRTRITTGNKNTVVLKAPPQDAKVRIMWHTHPNGCKARSSKCGLPTFSAIDVGNFLKQGINDKVVCHVLFTKEKRIFVLYLTDMFRARVSHVTDDVCQKVINDFKIMENSVRWEDDPDSYIDIFSTFLSGYQTCNMFHMDVFSESGKHPYVRIRR